MTHSCQENLKKKKKNLFQEVDYWSPNLVCVNSEVAIETTCETSSQLHLIS